MPIQFEGAIESIRFPYIHEVNSSYVLSMEYHFTEEFGPTITIHNLQVGALSFPASAFVDSVDFLRERGAIEGGHKPPQQSYRGSDQSSQGRLAPTRVARAAAVAPAWGTPSPSPKYGHPAPPTRDEPVYEDDISERFRGGVYNPQHNVVATSGMESFSPQRPQNPPRPQASHNPTESNEEGQDVDASDEENLDPDFTLEAAEIKKKTTTPKRSVRRRDEQAE